MPRGCCIPHCNPTPSLVIQRLKPMGPNGRVGGGRLPGVYHRRDSVPGDALPDTPVQRSGCARPSLSLPLSTPSAQRRGCAGPPLPPPLLTPPRCPPSPATSTEGHRSFRDGGHPGPRRAELLFASFGSEACIALSGDMHRSYFLSPVTFELRHRPVHKSVHLFFATFGVAQSAHRLNPLPNNVFPGTLLCQKKLDPHEGVFH